MHITGYQVEQSFGNKHAHAYSYVACMYDQVDLLYNTLVN